jgi:hypothetical protein
MRIWNLALLAVAGAVQPALAGDGALVRHLNGTMTLGGGYQALPEGGGGTKVEHVFTDGSPSDCRADGQIVDAAACGFVGTTGSSGGDVAEGWLSELSGNLAFPLDYKSGVQFDAGTGLLEGRVYAEGTFHLFWGEAGEGQFGPVLDFWTYDGAERLRVGGELQGYWGDVTGYLQGGYQWGDGAGSLDVAEGFYLCGRGTWYADPDAALWLGGGYGPAEQAVGFFGGELRPFAADAPAWSLTAEATLGSDEQWSALAGIRYRFGETQTLIAREREWLPLPTTPCATLGVESGRDGVVTNIWTLRDIP